MKKMHKLLKEINEITLKMEEQYPELYEHLDENPLTIPINPHPHLDTNVFSDYLESLKTLLQNHIDKHSK